MLAPQHNRSRPNNENMVTRRVLDNLPASRGLPAYRADEALSIGGYALPGSAAGDCRPAASERDDREIAQSQPEEGETGLPVQGSQVEVQAREGPKQKDE